MPVGKIWTIAEFLFTAKMLYFEIVSLGCLSAVFNEKKFGNLTKE